MAAWWTLSEDACSRTKGKQRSADELKEEYIVSYLRQRDEAIS